MRISISAFLFFNFFLCVSQGMTWTLVQTFPIQKGEIWTVDGLGNVITVRKDQLSKYSPNGKLLFDQSQKSLGRLNKIEPINTLKFVAFSEQQQTICFFDNSLTMMDKCIELGDYGVFNATQFTTSGQSDKLWVFDQVNSTLFLLVLNRLNQDQSIKNLMGILDAQNIVQMIEMQNKLFFVDSLKGVFVFDLYGTLLERINSTGVKWVQSKGDNLLMLIEGVLVIYDLKTGATTEIKLPDGSYDEFKFDENSVYLKSSISIQKFDFLLKE